MSSCWTTAALWELIAAEDKLKHGTLNRDPSTPDWWFITIVCVWLCNVNPANDDSLHLFVFNPVTWPPTIYLSTGAHRLSDGRPPGSFYSFCLSLCDVAFTDGYRYMYVTHTRTHTDVSLPNCLITIPSHRQPTHLTIFNMESSSDKLIQTLNISKYIFN